MESKEKKIVSLMMARDKTAIVLLYDNYSSALYGIVIRIIENDEKAKDIMQESFMKVWKNIDKYDEEKATLFTWLLRIFRNTAIDQLRKDNEGSSVDIDNEVGFVENKMNIRINPEILNFQRFLETIDKKHRSVIEHIGRLGLTQPLKAVSIPLGTTKSHFEIDLRSLCKINLPVITLLLNSLL